MAVQNGSQRQMSTTSANPSIKAVGFSTRIKQYFRRFYRLASSHLGLVIVLIVFSFLGAAIFQAIEGPHEEHEKYNVLMMREEIIMGVWNTTPAVKQNERAFKLLLRREMRRYETQLYTAFQNGMSNEADVPVWDFWGSLFYVATIFSTIGYGHISPVTDAGRIVTMLYATVSIPLCLIVMADLGKLFTRGIKFLWSYVRRFYYTGKCKKPANQTAPSPDQHQAQQHHYGQQHSKDRELDIDTAPAFVVDDEFNLPVIVAVMITVLYIFLGAILYTQWEDWTYLEAFYFIFISISTIGFGDVLPEHPKYFLVSSLYVLVGLSLVSMVINVIMESLSANMEIAKNKITEVSKTIGISLEDIEEEEVSQENSQSSTVKK